MNSLIADLKVALVSLGVLEDVAAAEKAQGGWSTLDPKTF